MKPKYFIAYTYLSRGPTGEQRNFENAVIEREKTITSLEDVHAIEKEMHKAQEQGERGHSKYLILSFILLQDTPLPG